ncbi:MAG: IscS subfamily cysteine desulfurase [Actinobacteria bacterium]|nr:IscS subfamily cysteine desulfurase [Actinomycetota bacterium]MCG2818101.1 IscS subfamily cysteine desulfurase [Actinomycetes bacterium]MBU4217636.1 IscS subfamily cysteine desulfurase [Actinomycetota bacterium]MBU4359699.1 IscS subfamily cysteine desulfurase [Actinomycetota bacterium]MBU4393223.1 IscS subfamily cysteine desulfurase [Actinomycetota bacterium]
MRTAYLDHAATTPPLPEVIEAMKPYLAERFGNPSALYALGRDSRRVLEESREKVASLIGAMPDEIVFTSGGTESDNMALLGVLLAGEGNGGHIVTTAVEHHAILETVRFLERLGYRATVVGVDSTGMVDPDDIRKAIRAETVLASVMHANNEVGTVEPLRRVADVCREAGVYLHSDTVQTVGNIPVDVDELGVDMLSMSGHKLYGPKGAGAIYVRRGTRVSGIIHGGEQERGMRAGTENIAGIVGLAAAAAAAARGMESRGERIAGLRNRLVDGILSSVEGVVLNGHPEVRLPNNAHLGIERVEGEAVCLHLDAVGICASTGSACTSEELEPSHVLLAMGIAPLKAHGSVRFTLGRGTTLEEIEYVLQELPPIVERLRAMAPL